jgi:D-arabinose 1-dehydrogenase-like Zn-dependent alcohol dehydrogenase
MANFLDYKTQQWDQRSVSLDRVTDTSLDEVLGYHSLKLSNINTVLVIGVGRGAAIKSLVERGKTVYATDISRKLVEVGMNFGATKAVLSPQMNTLPPVDLALCHLVVQHNVEPEVERLINDVNLNANGFGSYQYSTLAADSKMTPVMVYDFNDGELNVHSIERMKAIVSRTNKMWVQNIPSKKWRDKTFSWDWNILRFKNK